DKGDYQLEVTKPGYSFPSRLVQSNTDGEYAHVYRGELINFASDRSVVDVAVPIDPLKTEVGWKFKVVRFIRGRIYMATISMLVVGFVMSLLAVIGGQAS